MRWGEGEVWDYESRHIPREASRGHVHNISDNFFLNEHTFIPFESALEMLMT